jgi:hypothetical protein
MAAIRIRTGTPPVTRASTTLNEGSVLPDKFCGGLGSDGFAVTLSGWTTDRITATCAEWCNSRREYPSREFRRWRREVSERGT